ncbi:ATP-grasp domain-containing protein [Nonomuraea jiangxiensis]|uniref:ATP-grasp domain-containing protein n=1 Tax=Nonomuraea jiangxiensis TaxID=633440 RepID=A0A1G8IC49_9ACTN|nr:biotin carboxylase [Nonomuraea jiangxiensis]SDI16515.1 hypothetical protein SAMN05421869_104445 [Nonomuraea jiangxiensis]
MNGRPHVVVINRWQARYAEYERYLDHDRNAVTYVTTRVGAGPVPDGAAEVVVVEATDDLATVAAEVGRLARRHGAPAGVVALKEDDLLVAAALREEWGCPGPTRAELIPFRDKLVMARAVAAAGVAVPAFAPAPDVGAVVAFAERHGWPVVVKPRAGAASEGVAVASGPEDVELPADAMVQVFDPGRIYHVDGVFDGTGLAVWRAARYLNTCLAFRSGTTLGAVQEDDPEVLSRVGRFAERALRALSAKPVVFHLELFVDAERCAFLEVGARVGGGEIPFLWREVHGYDLMEAAFRLSLGQDPPVPPLNRAGGPVAGELLTPAPAQRPCRIVEATPMLGRVPGLYAEVLLRPGEVLPAADSYYEHVGGRFRFRGPTSAAVEEAIMTVARGFRVGATALSEAVAR